MDALFESIREMTEQAELVKAQLERLDGLYPVLYVGEQNKLATRGDYLTRFENNTTKGVEKHGVEWLTANERAVAVAERYNIIYDRPEMKAFLTDLVLQILNRK